MTSSIQLRPVMLTVVVHPDGQVVVNGPVHEKEWCLAALRRAIAEIEAYEPPILYPINERRVSS